MANSDHGAEMPDDTLMDQRIGILLRAGMYTAAAVTLLGGILVLAHHGKDRVNYGSFQRLPLSLRSPKEILVTSLQGHPESIIQLGMLLLIGTPVARVVFCLGAFALKRDGLYVAISALVLAVLVYSLVYH